MPNHPANLLAPYALGTLSHSSARRVDTHLRGCRDCTDRLREIYEALSLMALGQTPEEGTPPAR